MCLLLPKVSRIQSQVNPFDVQQSKPLQYKSQVQRTFELQQPAAHTGFRTESNWEFILQQFSFVQCFSVYKKLSHNDLILIFTSHNSLK